MPTLPGRNRRPVSLPETGKLPPSVTLHLLTKFLFCARLCRQVRREVTPRGHAAAAAKSLQSCPTLCDPIDGSPPGSPIPGILQARILEWAWWVVNS